VNPLTEAGAHRKLATKNLISHQGNIELPGFSRRLSHETQETNIRIHAVCPLHIVTMKRSILGAFQ
jgi:NAD(P)-dependent dehydrogenase (short-subunit alcohol dehydrogenase family)